jgi:hypothetical protein
LFTGKPSQDGVEEVERILRVERRAVLVRLAVADGGHPELHEARAGGQRRLRVDAAEVEPELGERLGPGLAQDAAAFRADKPPPGVVVVAGVPGELFEVGVGLVGGAVEFDAAGDEQGGVPEAIRHGRRAGHGEPPEVGGETWGERQAIRYSEQKSINIGHCTTVPFSAQRINVGRPFATGHILPSRPGETAPQGQSP